MNSNKEQPQGSGEPVADAEKPEHRDDCPYWPNESPCTCGAVVNPQGAPFGWLMRGGGAEPVQPDDRWTYFHGPVRPVCSWTHQEVVPLYTAPPSAQQATGSGQVLTDEPTDEEVAEAIEACFSAEHEWPDGDGATVRAFLKYRAAATQAQPFAGFKVVVDPSMPAGTMKLVAATKRGAA